MTTPTANIILSQLGYSVCSVSRGVYHLRRVQNESTVIESVALIYCPGTIDEVDRVKLIELDVSQVADKKATIPKIIQHWGLLDARRIEESGVDAYTISRADFGGVIEEGLTFQRPGDTERLRHAVRMSTGEVVCFN